MTTAVILLTLLACGLLGLLLPSLAREAQLREQRDRETARADRERAKASRFTARLLGADLARIEARATVTHLVDQREHHAATHVCLPTLDGIRGRRTTIAPAHCRCGARVALAGDECRDCTDTRREGA